MKARLFLGPLAGAFVTIAVACSSSTPAPPDQTVSEFCGDWAKAFCQLSTICQFDATACATNQTTVCTNFANAALASGSRQYSQPAGKACIDALSSAYANSPASIPASTVMSLQDQCSRAFTGNQASDKPCTSDYDCAGTLVCEPILGQTTSVCAAVNQKNLGDICGDPGDECQGDSYCAATSTAPQCIATPVTGGACSTAVPCGASDRCESGICIARAALGQVCATNDDCSPTAPLCDQYPPAACVNALTFARGSDDCEGIAGTDTNAQPDAAVPVPDASTDSATSSDDSSTGTTDSAAPVDAPTGG